MPITFGSHITLSAKEVPANIIENTALSKKVDITPLLYIILS
jgi:hypothetical protein